VEKRMLSELNVENPYLRMGTDVSELEKSIQTLGLIAPLVITPENVILAGARRYQAMLNLGLTETPVMVVEGNTLERELVSIDENLVRKDLSKIEVESHLRRAKKIYQDLFPEAPIEVLADELEKKREVLPAEKFLIMVSEKTGLSPKQIHEAINRDEMAAPAVKEARINGKLSLSQTNEIVKLKKEDQAKAIEHIRELPVREIKNFVKIAKVQGVEEAIHKTPHLPHQREFGEIEQNLKKLIKKFKQLEIEGMTLFNLPSGITTLMEDLITVTRPDFHPSMQEDETNLESYQ
jgi:ParB family chromosome partitioning protein